MHRSVTFTVNHATAQVKSWRQRITEELRFAEALLPLHPEHREAWAALIQQARRSMETLESVSPERMAEQVLGAERILAPIGEVAKTYRILCAGHAHIDMNWLWPWQETVAVANDTFTTALALMDEFPDFCLTQSQGAVYELILRYSPELFERIRQRVKEGRWEVAAASWVEGDKNLSCGESLARHMQYTRRFMKEHFDLNPQDVFIQWEPDTFGHAHTIPSIVTQGGVRCYYMCRGGTKELPPVFWWKAPDGSRVLVNRETDWYNNAIDPHLVDKLLKFNELTGLRQWMAVYGVGDHGGGPTRRDLRRCGEMNGWPIYPAFQFTTAKAYFSQLLEQSDRWPEIDRELNFEFAGCYTSQSAIKRANRFGENLMLETELAATLAKQTLDRPYPEDTLREAWLDVLFSQFHDILPGSGVKATRDCNQGAYQKVVAAAGMVKTHALREVAGAVDLSFAATTSQAADDVPSETAIGQGAGAGRGLQVGSPHGPGRMIEPHQVSMAANVSQGPRGLVVFNPTAWRRCEIVTVSVWDGDADYSSKPLKDRRFVVRDSAGNLTPTQMVKHNHYWGHEYVELAFPVSVGPLGYTGLSIEESAEESARPAPAAVGGARVIAELEGSWGVTQPAGRMAMENEHLLVEFDRATGGIRSLIDKATGVEFACSQQPLGLLEYVLERPHDMSAWILADPMKRVCPLEVESFKTTLSGPHIASMAATVRVGQSRFEMTYSLHGGSKQVDIDIYGMWLERGGSEIGTPKLMIRLPLNLQMPEPRYEIPFGAIERNLPDGREVPALRWADVTGMSEGRTIGCALLNDCKYGHSLDGSVLRQTLLRSSYDPDPLPELGEHRVRLAVVPHVGRASNAELLRWGAGHNHPLICVNTDIHSGKLSAAADGVASLSADHVVLTHMKATSGGGGVIVRLQETAGQGGQVRMRLNPQLLGRYATARLVDLLEQPTGAAVKIQDDEVLIDVPAHGIVSVELRP